MMLPKFPSKYTHKTLLVGDYKQWKEEMVMALQQQIKNHNGNMITLDKQENYTYAAFQQGLRDKAKEVLEALK